MRFIVLDNGLSTEAGHHFRQNKSISEAVKKRNISFELYAAFDVEQAIQDALGAVPFFSKHLYITDAQLNTGFEKITAEYAAAYYQDLQKLENVTSEDLILVHSCDHIQYQAIIKWLVDFFDEENMPNVHLLFPFSDFYPAGPRATVAMHSYRQAFENFLPPSEKVVLSSVGPTEIYQQIARYPVIDVPIPLLCDFKHDRGHKSQNIKKRISYFGHSRVAKGVLLLPDIISRAQKRNVDAEYFIQISPYEVFKIIHDQLELIDGNIHLHKGFLSDEAYRQEIDKTDIFLLPYSPEFYRFSTSGVFTEAMIQGKVLILPNNTWIANEVRKFGGGMVTFNAHDGVEIARCINYAVRHYDKLHAASQKSAQVFFEHHSAHNFLNVVLAHMKGKI